MLRSFTLLLLALGLPLSTLAHALPDGKAPAEESSVAVTPKQRAARIFFSDRELVTKDGRHVAFYSDVLRNRTVAINFIFTRCTDVCPTQTARLAAVQSLLPEAGERRIELISISVDPQNDTPPALKEYAERFGAKAGWTFLTGNRENVDYVLRRLGQLTMTPQSHTTLFLLGNVNTGHWLKLHPDSDPAEIARWLRTLADETNETRETRGVGAPDSAPEREKAKKSRNE